MRKFFNHILSLVVAVGLLAGCTDGGIDFTQDINSLKDLLKDLQTQVDALKSDQIKTVEQQVAAIRSSLTDLQSTDNELQNYISTLQAQVTALEAGKSDLEAALAKLKNELDANKEVIELLESYKNTVSSEIETLRSSISALQLKDEELQKRIEDLKNYTDNGIGKVKDWATATFATLEEYNATAAVVASIQSQIEAINSQIAQLKDISGLISKEDVDKAVNGLGDELRQELKTSIEGVTAALNTAVDEITAAYTTAIANAVTAAEAGIKDWVNSLLEGYYTAEQTDALLAALKKELGRSDGGSGSGSGSTDVDDILKAYEDKLEKTKAEITDAYRSAISKAINDYNGTITSRIASEISSVNTKISSLRSDISALESKVSGIDKRLTALEELVRNLINSGNNRRISGETTEIDGVTWMNYNVGADEDDLYGDIFTYEQAKKACPDGYRLPTIDEVAYLSDHYYRDTYNSVVGSWYSGNQTYSSNIPAIFLPILQEGLYYWSCTEKSLTSSAGGPYIWYINYYNDEPYARWDWNEDSARKSYVRCVKDDKTYREIIGETTEIDGVTWMNYDAESEVDGGATFDDAPNSCPEGYRVPTIEEFESLARNASDEVYYLGSSGRWYSGSQQYSDSAPAIFFRNDTYWSSSSSDSYYNFAYAWQSWGSSDGWDKRQTRSVRCVKKDNPDGIQISEGTTVINGMAWMNYNLGANDSNLKGNVYTYDEARTACPDGYRLPDADEMQHLFRGTWYSSSNMMTYNGFNGYFFSGSQRYSTSVPSIFFPFTTGYWAAPYDNKKASTYDDSSFLFDAQMHGYYSSSSYWGNNERYFVRCLKDEPDSREAASRKISGETTVIDGVTWLNYNVGASESYVTGDIFTPENVATACPDGYRVPTMDELAAVAANYSDWVRYNGISGRWLSGSQKYSNSAPAIFLPGCVLYIYGSPGYFSSQTGESENGTEYYGLRLSLESVGTCGYSGEVNLSVRCVAN